MSTAFQQVELSESEIQREIDALTGLADEFDDDESQSWIRDLDLEDPADKTRSFIACQLDGSAGGIDLNTTNNWIFPVQSYEKRKYQVDMSRSALMQNTLIILPTGLGKTFIASVVIYNFMRFFPNSKVIFMAPTRPLVTQQMAACYDIVGIAKDETAEMTGRIKKEKRFKLWNEKRLFFCTPQTLESDIEEQSFPAHSIKLVVFDEAHRARGEYAYCKVMRFLRTVQSSFRVLALTATAGKSKEVIEIILNLLISKIEYREETSIDVRQYTHQKKIECLEVKLPAEIKKIIGRFEEFIDPNVRMLKEADIIKTCNVSKGYLVMELKSLVSNTSMPKQVKKKYADLLSATVGLYSSLDMLQRLGIQLFIKSLRDGSDPEGKRFKYYVNLDPKLKQLMRELEEKYGNLFDGIHTSNQVIDYGHPKFDMLKAKMQEYFNNNGAKVIIFTEFQDGAILINSMMQQMKPKVLSQVLIGQSNKMTQKQQLAIMKDFREGRINTLVCTCVGEEGLDIGEVDLVICFDVATKNLTRFVQRIGRTGRKRQGCITVLASEGREYHNTKELIHLKDTNNKSITRNKDIQNHFYKGPSLFPPNFNPKCIEMKFNVNHDEEESDGESSKKKKTKKPKKVPSKGSIKDHFKPRNMNEVDDDPVLDDLMEFQEISGDEMQVETLQVVENYDIDAGMDVLNSINDGICSKLKDIKDNQIYYDHLSCKASRRVKSIENLNEFISRPLNQNASEIIFDDVVIQESSQEKQVSRYFDPYGMTEMNKNSSFMPLNTDFIKENFPDSPLKSSTSKKNFTTPLRRIFKDNDDSPALRDFNPHQKDMFASTPVVSRVQIQSPVKVKKTFEFLGISSVDDIFEGCLTFDEIPVQPSSCDSEPYVDSEGLKFLIEDVCSDEANNVLMPRDQEGENNDVSRDEIECSIIGDDVEEIGPSQVPEVPKVPEPKLALTESQIKLIDLKNLDDLFACNEEIPESKPMNVSNPEEPGEDISNSSDKTIEYDVEEEFIKITKSTGDLKNHSTGASENVTNVSRKRPNFNKLITAMKDDSFLTQERKPLQEKSMNQMSSHLRAYNSNPVMASTYESPKSPSTPIVRRRRVQKKKNHQGFLATQAAVDDSIASSDENSDEHDNSIITDFLHDDTIETQNHTHMYAQYVQSLKSPVGRFKIPQSRPVVNFSQVFSQMPHEMESDEDSDLDSFVVNDEILPEEEESEPDELEVAERKLREKNRKRKKQLKNGGTKKRKIIRPLDSSSDEEDNELEKMRKELLKC